jgi:hypothetical protein
MAFEDEPPLERSYPYRTGWKVLGCTALVFGVTGFSGLALAPFGCEQVRNGNEVFGWIAIVIGLLLAPTTLMAVIGGGLAVKDAIRPALLRLTPVALLLPSDARGQPLEKDEQGNPKTDGPRAHPEEIPFTAIRWIRREAGATPGNDRLLIVHDLSATTLELQQYMMRAADFDELETVLRAAVPEAFVALPVPTSPPPERPDGD